ncbi:ECF RNA polymerase sigma factor SigE [Rosistilla oblonga]|uniref:ECF RNA polymerase sigma factor SigE n=1 Tax=Rosistilla oblonga TaxID=2527990 RepID=A0A518J1U2_9BACT|nr:sigma-70 family RNA polymerase sigma factor [Rosistilla oblonga]QDV12572.1 ECF RNA polymerase sigma factor SigE [Rosistilla oblonga]QDV59307.1 ECF RNA polymerase sigma factor SigE [Rosistilla oblonga]
MSEPDPISEQVRECADRIAESGAAALSGLYDLTSGRLVRFATTVTRNQHDAEDAVQSALVKVADNPRTLRRAERPWPYLLQMVRNESLLILRRKKRWRFATGIFDLLTRCPVDELEQEETYRMVWSAMRRLPPKQSEVVALKIWENFTFAQIGEVLMISPATAASRYRYGIAKLEIELRGEEVEERR